VKRTERVQQREPADRRDAAIHLRRARTSHNERRVPEARREADDRQQRTRVLLSVARRVQPILILPRVTAEVVLLTRRSPSLSTSPSGSKNSRGFLLSIRGGALGSRARAPAPRGIRDSYLVAVPAVNPAIPDECF